jgi:predicted acetyltransferase
MTVTLTRTTPATDHIVRNMFVAYFYDMSQYDDNLIINAHGLPMWLPFGLPGPTTLDECIAFNWWIRDLCECYIIQSDGSPAGFVILLTKQEKLPKGTDYELMDFYIAPKYRRSGIGAQAARLAFDLHHGTWIVYQLERNLPARSFWQTVINHYTNGNYTNLDGGTQQRFQN